MDKKAFFTLESIDKNRFTQFPKKIRLYTRWAKKYLPSAGFITRELSIDFPKKNISWEFKYNGSPTEEQSFVIDIIERRLREFWYGCWLIVMWTWKGKSHIAMQIVNLLKVKTLILCHNVKTLKEMQAKFLEFTGYSVWVYYAKEKNIKDITITTHTSFLTGNGIFEWFDCIIYDEADYSFSDKMITALCNSWASLMYGMTGTPYTKDLNTEWMEKAFGKMIQFSGEKYNIVPSKIYVHRFKTSLNYEFSNWAEQREEMFMDTERIEYMGKIVEYYYKERNACLILSERVSEVELLSGELQKRNIQHGIITGSTRDEEDRNTIEKLDSWKIKIIIGTNGKMSRWVDIPIIDTVFMFSPLKFEWTITQAVGRALRKHPSKKDVILIDFSDDCVRQQRYQRIKAYKKEYWIDSSNIIIYPYKNDSTNHLLP